MQNYFKVKLFSKLQAVFQIWKALVYMLGIQFLLLRNLRSSWRDGTQTDRVGVSALSITPTKQSEGVPGAGGGWGRLGAGGWERVGQGPALYGDDSGVGT